MRYKNKKNGTVIDVKGIITGGDWEEEKTPSRPSKKKAGDKNDRTIRDGK